MKKSLAFILIFITSFLTSCEVSLPTIEILIPTIQPTQTAIDEFSQYDNEKQEVAMFCNSSLYFKGYDINFSKLFPGEEFFYGLLIKNNKIYFSTTTVNPRKPFYIIPQPEEHTFKIYESNFSGTEISLIYSRHFETTPISSYAKDDSFYIMYFTSNKLFETNANIDKYTISTGECVTIASGPDCSMNDYRTTEESKYKIDVEQGYSSSKEPGKITITDTETGEIRIIDDDYLKNTIYIESLKRFGYGAIRFDISHGHILLLYMVRANEADKIAYVVFEYDFDADRLDYKALLFAECFPYDHRVMYIGSSE